MTFLELAKDRYSVRAYKDQPIEDEKLNAILEAGKAAPTACNFQPQKIYVVKSEENRNKLAEICKCTFKAPVILVIAYDKNRAWKNKLMPGYNSGETDTAIVTTHMMLEAWEQGIGSCWVGMFNADQVSAALNLPEDVLVTALMPIGYPVDDAEPIGLHFASRENEDMVEIL